MTLCSATTYRTSEKRYTTFRLDVRNPGGHSSVPVLDNAIYHLAAGLTRLADHEFPVQLNETTRAWLERAAAFQPPAIGQAMRAVAAGTADEAALEELASRPVYNAQLRTTCVATMLDGGHAENALPQLASATVNLPHHFLVARPRGCRPPSTKCSRILPLTSAQC